MNRQFAKYRTFAFCLSLFGLCALPSIIGCVPSVKSVLPWKGQNSDARLESAMEAYEREEFQKAAEDFRLVFAGAENPDVQKTALHGLACSRFVLATTVEEFEDAYRLWKQWREAPGLTPPDEKCRLYGPVLDKWFAAVNEEQKRIEAEKGPAKTARDDPQATVPENDAAESALPPPQTVSPIDPAYDEALRREAAKNEELRKLLKKREFEIRTLKKRAKKMEEDMKALEEQLSAIEEIHQEINEKKKGIQGP